MTKLTTFGWEQEFGTGAPELVRELHTRGLASSPDLHDYHCNCDGCLGSHALHGQRDSSCSGEVISRIYVHGNVDDYYEGYSLYDDADEILPQVQHAAVAVDAEPGMTAGFHVHVGIAHLNDRMLADSLWAFLRWEPILLNLASGRFTAVRGGMNSGQRDMHNGMLTSWCGTYGVPIDQRGASGAITALETLDAASLEQVKLRSLMFNNEADRHSNLNTRTRHRTFEYRLWNSTRSAWRLDLFTRVSVALVDPAVVRAMNAAPIVHRGGEEHRSRLCDILDSAGHPRAAELARRQFDYRSKIRDAGVPDSLAVLY